jgi:hydroxyacylglutathione hydrolase
MQVKALFANNSLRNYIYLLEDTASKQAICIDPFDAQMVFDYLSLKEYQLVEIWNTHFHHDHIRGNEDLAKMTQAKIRKFEGGEKEEVFGYQMEVLFSPGHTLDHVTFLLEGEKNSFFQGIRFFNRVLGIVKTVVM